MTPTNSKLLETAIAAATAGSNHAAAQRGRNQDANDITSHDVKLKLDVECQAIISRTILDVFPDHFILGEEDASKNRAPAPGQYEWVVDPIDGTVNFFHSNPHWCSSVAVRLNGQTLAGCVSAPDVGMLFHASADGPALCNGKPIHASKTRDIELAMVHTGADKSEDKSHHAFRFFTAIAGSVQRIRVCGAAALDICLVAAGASDGYFEPGIYIWDIAAADLILRRAGGQGEIMKEFNSGKMGYLGTNGILHKTIASILIPLL